MKRILLVGLVSVVLSGCGEKKVTEEMLIGEWECSYSLHGDNWIDEDFQESGPIQTDKGNMKYFKKNNILYFNFENQGSHPFQLDTFYSGKELIITNNDESVKQRKAITYFSHDKFKATINSEYTFNDSVTDKQNIDVEMICERIKE